MSGVDTLNDLNVARALTWRYVFALLLIACLSTAAWLSLHLVISEQKNTAAVVNVSGRQRMLSQRTALFSQLLVNTPQQQREAIRKKLEAAISLMERSHHDLLHGNKATGLPDKLTPAVHALYFDGPDALDGQVQAYTKAVRAWLETDDIHLTPNSPQLQSITEIASNKLLISLDRMVTQYQIEGEKAIVRMQTAETIFWIATLLLLVLEATLIFHPFARHIRVIIAKLQKTTDALRTHHDQLEITVKQRTSELENRRRALAESEEKFRLISTNAKDAIVIINHQEQIVYWNPAAEKIFGFTALEMTGQNLHDRITPEAHRKSAHTGFEHFRQCGDGEVIGKTFDIMALRKNGEEFPIALSISSFRFQNNWHALGIMRDITERKLMEDQVRQLAFYDTLTQLPNRRLLHDRLTQAIAASRRNGYYGAVMFLDLDNFKSLNDSYGHVTGDLLLIEAAHRLKRCVRETDTVARFGGDEFVVMLCQLDTSATESKFQAEIIAEKIRSSLSEPYLLTVRQEGLTEQVVVHRCSASIGVTLFSNHEGHLDDLLKWADAAMYRAKRTGRNHIEYHDGIDLLPLTLRMNKHASDD